MASTETFEMVHRIVSVITAKKCQLAPYGISCRRRRKNIHVGLVAASMLLTLLQEITDGLLIK